MKQFKIINILDMIGAIGEVELKRCLSSFSCPVNPEVERFIADNGFKLRDFRQSST